MLRLIFSVIAALLVVGSAHAEYPSRPVRMINANPPGGPVDILARVLSLRLAELWKQPVVVENRPGGSSIISTRALVESPADGHTLGLVVASALTIVPFAVNNFDPVNDLQPISLVARTPFLFVVSADSPIQQWSDFLAESKKRELNIGSYSVGSAFHLIWEQVARKAGIKALYVPSSSGRTLSDLIGGQLDIVLDTPSSAKGLLDSGRLRAIAITSPNRFAGLPNTPTLSESGMPGYAPQPWIGLMAPAGTPKAIVTKIQADVVQVLKDPGIQQQMQTLGMIPVGSSADEFAATIQADRADMKPLVKEVGIRLQ